MLSLLVCLVIGQTAGLEGFDRSIITLRAGQLAKEYQKELNATRRYVVSAELRRLCQKIDENYSLDDAKEILKIAEEACVPFDKFRPEPTKEKPKSQPIIPAKSWHEGVINGKRVQIWGVIENGQIKYLEEEQPQTRVQPTPVYQSFPTYQPQPYCPPGQA